MEWRWRRLEDAVQKWHEIDAGSLDISRRSAGSGIGVHDWEINLLLICPKIEEEFINLVDDLFDAGVRSIDLVDHENDWQRACKRLGEDIPRLWERTLRGVDEQ